MRALLMAMQLVFGDGEEACESKYTLFPNEPNWYVLDASGVYAPKVDVVPIEEMS